MIRKHTKWSKDKVIKELIKAKMIVGHSPTIAEINDAKRGLYRACCHYFGSSNKAKKKSR